MNGRDHGAQRGGRGVLGRPAAPRGQGAHAAAPTRTVARHKGCGLVDDVADLRGGDDDAHARRSRPVGVPVGRRGGITGRRRGRGRRGRHPTALAASATGRTVHNGSAESPSRRLSRRFSSEGLYIYNKENYRYRYLIKEGTQGKVYKRKLKYLYNQWNDVEKESTHDKDFYD